MGGLLNRRIESDQSRESSSPSRSAKRQPGLALVQSDEGIAAPCAARAPAEPVPSPSGCDRMGITLSAPLARSLLHGRCSLDSPLPPLSCSELTKTIFSQNRPLAAKHCVFVARGLILLQSLTILSRSNQCYFNDNHLFFQHLLKGKLTGLFKSIFFHTASKRFC